MPESKRRKPKKGHRQPTKPATAEVKQKGPSPTWYVALMAALMGIGVVLVIVRFLFNLDNLFTIVGLAMIAGGFFMTTNYR